MSFEQGPIRPPSEANSLLIRVARNCPWNRCRFCPVYKDARFSRRPVEDVLADIDAIAAWIEVFTGGAEAPAGASAPDPTARQAAMSWHDAGMQSVFLQDANPLASPVAEIVAILGRLRQRFPHIRRITTYARSKTVARLAPEELAAMGEAGLNRVHIGFESGSDRILELMDKGVTKAIQVEAGKKIKAAGMELSAYYMPGLGGRELWRENALETADLMNQVDPHFIRMRTLAIPDRLELATDVAEGRFSKANDVEAAKEILLFIRSLEGIGSVVVSDHILNLIQDLEGRLPDDRDSMVARLETFLSLAPEEQALYRIGRREGLFAGLVDLMDPRRRVLAERMFRELHVDADNIDAICDQLVKRFI
jgi:hypothetical protein